MSMHLKDIKNEEDLWRFMTEPSQPLLESLYKTKDDIIILGGSGKMGKELVGLINNADKLNGIERKITVASTFSAETDLDLFQRMGVTCLKGDLADELFLKKLPPTPLVVYMMGFKFGSGQDWRKAFHLNSIVPYRIGELYPESKIVVFSSGNPYPHTDKGGAGCRENHQLDPQGIYGWSIVARESSFRTTAMQFPDQKICLFRLMYAQHLYYGILVDLCRMILKKEPISLQMPSVNLISQRDANELALRAFEYCENPPTILNAAGPVYQLRELAMKLAGYLGNEPEFLDDEGDKSLLADDSLAISMFGKYRDDPEDLTQAAASWVLNKGKYWNKPTKFGSAGHKY